MNASKYANKIIHTKEILQTEQIKHKHASPPPHIQGETLLGNSLQWLHQKVPENI